MALRASCRREDDLAEAPIVQADGSETFEVLGAERTAALLCPLGDGLEVEVNHRTRSDLLDG